MSVKWVLQGKRQQCCRNTFLQNMHYVLQFDSNLCLNYTDRETIHTAKMTNAHAQFFSANNQLLLPNLKTFAHYTLHEQQEALCIIYTVKHNYILISSTVGVRLHWVQLHVSVPIYWPSSGGTLTYWVAIKHVWGVYRVWGDEILLFQWWVT
jgi:hypothetical protein